MSQPLPTIPHRMTKLPLDYRGFPIPWFVAVLENGERDFRVADAAKRQRAIAHDLCWVCGEKLGRFKAFVIGPMCVVNRVTSEPPCHLDCAEFSAKACPFLSRPRMRRNEKDLPDGHGAPGIALTRNPGCTCVYVTNKYKPFAVENGWLIRLGEPTNLGWFAEGRPADRAQVMASIESGYPLLLAEAQKDGPAGIVALEACYKQALPLLPAV